MVQIESSSVIRSILQYLHANGLSKSAEQLSAESNIYLNSIKDSNRIKFLVDEGNWVELLTALNNTETPKNVVDIIFQLIFLSLIEVKDFTAATLIFKRSATFHTLESNDNPLFTSYKNALDNKILSDGHYSRKKELKDSLIAFLDGVELVDESSNSLLDIIRDAVKWRTRGEKLLPSVKFDCLHGFITSQTSSTKSLSVPSSIISRIPMAKISSIACQPSSTLLAVCDEDGLITLLDCLTGKPHTDYINADTMAVPSKITCCRFSRDGSYFAVGCADGSVALWRIINGSTQPIRYYNNFSTHPIKSVDFMDNTRVIACGNKTMFVLGLRSGSVLRQIIGVDMAFTLSNGKLFGVGKELILFDDSFVQEKVEFNYTCNHLFVKCGGDLALLDGFIFDPVDRQLIRVSSMDIVCAAFSSNFIFIVGRSEIEVYYSTDKNRVASLEVANVKCIEYEEKTQLLLTVDSEGICIWS